MLHETTILVKEVIPAWKYNPVLTHRLTSLSRSPTLIEMGGWDKFQGVKMASSARA
jgi:hypothetical protein